MGLGGRREKEDEGITGRNMVKVHSINVTLCKQRGIASGSQFTHSLSCLLSLPALLEANCCVSRCIIETHTARSRVKSLAGSLKGTEGRHQQPMEWGWTGTQPAPFLVNLKWMHPESSHETTALADTAALACERLGGNGAHVSRFLTHNN